MSATSATVPPSFMNIQPGHGCAEQPNSLLLLRVEAQHFHQCRSWRLVFGHLTARLRLRDRIDHISLLSVAVFSRIDRGLLDIVQHVERVSWRFRYCEPVVKCEPSGDATKSNDNPPHFVDAHGTLPHTFSNIGYSNQIVFEYYDYNEGYQGCCKLAKALHGEDGCDNTASVFGAGELCCDDRTEGIWSSGQ